MIESKLGVYYMRIDFNTNNQVNQNFRAVNQKYLKDAQVSLALSDTKVVD